MLETNVVIMHDEHTHESATELECCEWVAEYEKWLAAE